MRMILKEQEVIPGRFHMEYGDLVIMGQANHTVHRCPCKCGNYVHIPITPSPHGWEFDEETITFKDSILNRSCGSHYYITNGEVKWIKHSLPRLIWMLVRQWVKTYRHTMHKYKPGSRP